MSGHKYKATMDLKRLIDSGKVSPDIDIKKVLKAFDKIEKVPPKKRYSDSWKPRFYNRAMTMNSRSKKQGDGKKITAEQLEEIWTDSRGVCKHCGSTKNLCFDHIISYFNGGTNTVDNIQLLCRTCNMIKGVGVI